MTSKTAITVNRPRDEVERRWRSPEFRPEFLGDAGVAVTFVDAPGDHGTEIHVDLGDVAQTNPIGQALRKVLGSEPVAKAKDDLRRFKALVETGEIPRSDAAPEGELAERKLRQRPAQPLGDRELEKVGA